MAWERQGDRLVPAVGLKFDHPPRMAERGRVIMGKKGEKRQSKKGGTYRIPMKLDHFELVTTEKDPETDQFLPDKSATKAYVEYMESLGVELQWSKKDNKVIIKEVPIIFIRDEIEDIFMTYNALYSGGMWWCRGVGENDPDNLGRNAIRRLKGSEGVYREERWHPKCGWGPCGPQCNEYAANKCKTHGILQFTYAFAPEFGGVYQFRTTGINTIKNITASLMQIRNLTGGMLALVPELYLTYQRRQVTDREGRAHRIPVATVLLKKKPAEVKDFLHDIYKLRIEAQRARQRSFNQVLPFAALPPAATGEESEEEVTDVVAEFVPDMQEQNGSTEPFVEDTPAQVEEELKEAEPEEIAETLLREYGTVNGVVLACQEAEEPVPVEPEILVKVAVEMNVLDEKLADAKLAELRGEEPVVEDDPVFGDAETEESLPKNHYICDGCGDEFDKLKNGIFAAEGKTYCYACLPPRTPLSETAEGNQEEPTKKKPDIHLCAKCGELVEEGKNPEDVIDGLNTLCAKCAKKEPSGEEEIDEEPGQTGLSIEATLPKKKRGRPRKKKPPLT